MLYFTLRNIMCFFYLRNVGPTFALDNLPAKRQADGILIGQPDSSQREVHQWK